MDFSRERVTKVERLPDFDDEYVYDVIMGDLTTPYFFANGVLVHNSCYFLMSALVDNTEDAVQLADAIVDHVNASFPEFMRTAFFCQPEFDSLIRANREIVAETGIIRAKKNYVFLVRDNEGKRYDTDYLKLQGGDLKVSSTPEVIRAFLKGVTLKILKGASQSDVSADVIAFREQLGASATANPLEFASVSTVKTLDEYVAKWERIEKTGMGKVTIPSHVRAAINHNECVREFAPTESVIRGGDKVRILWLKANPQGFKNMAFSSDIEEIPSWFHQHFEVDLKLTEQKLVDDKLANTFDPIGWQVPTYHTVKVNSLLSFE